MLSDTHGIQQYGKEERSLNWNKTIDFDQELITFQLDNSNLYEPLSFLIFKINNTDNNNNVNMLAICCVLN